MGRASLRDPVLGGGCPDHLGESSDNWGELPQHLILSNCDSTAHRRPQRMEDQIRCGIGQ
jgi:hypothetical protein